MSGGAPPGARANGLPTTSWWAPLGECDPRATGHLLDELARASIPAYAQPSLGSRGSYLELHPPRRPMDSLYVDSSVHRAARELLAGQLDDGEPPVDAPRESDPGTVPTTDTRASLLPSDEDTDAIFAAIVAGFHGPDATPGTTLPRPPSSTPPPAPQSPSAPTTPVRPRRRASDRPPGLLDPGGLLHDSSIGEGRPPHKADPFEGDDEHFERPPAQPAPPMHPATRMSIAAIIAGIALLVAPAVSSFADVHVASAVGAILVAGGTLGLVLRMRDDPPDDGGDGGAVV